MKKFFAIMALVASMLSVQTAQAQIKFGLKGGLNVTDMSLSSDVYKSSNQTGFFIGPTVLFNLPVVGLGIDASALYDQREAKVETNGESGKLVNGKVKQQAINIPINLRYSFGLGTLAGLYLAAGPQFGFNVGDKSQDLLGGVAEWKLKNSNFSVNVGAGLMLLSHLQIGANYNIVCGKTGSVNVLNGTKEAFNGRTNTWQISAAYYF